MKKTIALLSVFLAASLAFNVAFLFQRHENQQRIQALESAGTSEVLSLLANCDQYARYLESLEPLEPSFRSVLAERLGIASSKSPSVQTLLDSCPGSELYSIRSDSLSGKMTLCFVLSSLLQAVLDLSQEEGGERRKLVQQAFSMLAEQYGQALSICGLTASSTLTWQDYSKIYLALLPLLENSLSPSGKLYYVIEQLTSL